MYSIESLKDKYNPNHDVGVDFAWIDYDLLLLIEAQQKAIEKLEQRVRELENNPPCPEPKREYAI